MTAILLKKNQIDISLCVYWRFNRIMECYPYKTDSNICFPISPLNKMNFK